MILLQKVIPLCCEQESQAVQHITEGNQESHIPLSSNPIFWLAMLLQNSRVESYSLDETSRLTS
jgi:hypothetical protein